MAVIRINASRDGELMLAGGDPHWRQPVDAALAELPPAAPVTFVVHGYRYAPRPDGQLGGTHCPHGLLYRADDIGPVTRARRPPLAAWPRALGFREDDPRHGLCIAFGWDARRGRGASLIDVGMNDFAAVYADAAVAGRALARVFGLIGRRHPVKRTSVMAHSLGARVVLRAMAERPDMAPGRVLLLGAAEYAGEARRVLFDQDRTGRRRADMPEFLSVSSRANDFYDWLFELFAPAPRQRGDRPLGARGLGTPHLRWMDIELDHPALARWLGGQGMHLTRLPERVTHWSFYSDPGAMLFWSRVLRGAPGWDLAGLRARRIPEARSARWSRLPRLMPRLRLRGGTVAGEAAPLTQT